MDVTTATVRDIRDWLTERIAKYVDLPPDEVDPTENLVDFGVDSLSKAELELEIEELFQLEVEPEFFRHCLTIEDVAKALHDRVRAREIGGSAA
jgi:polyketide synthase PksN